MAELSLEYIQRLPKTDLHCHLDGSLRLTTILDLAQQQGVKLPADDPDRLAKIIKIGQDCDSLVDYLKGFDVTLSVMQTEEALYRTAYELAEDAAREGVWLMEVRYSPMLHTRQGLRLTTIVETVLAALRQGERDFGIRSGVILCGIRSISAENSLGMAELAVAYKNKGVVGFDLAGAEYNFPAKDHKQAFQLVLDNNINCTAHAGEAYGPESVAQAIHFCGAHRIGHGTRLREDGDLLNYVNDHRIPLEVCLSSNVQTRAVRDIASHPAKFYLDFGLRTTINTDNRLITDTTVSKEMWLAHRHLSFTLNDLKTVITAGFKSAFMPFSEKQQLLRRVTRELARFGDDGVILEEASESTQPGSRALGTVSQGRPARNAVPAVG
jgi:adenosine deaminase